MLALPWITALFALQAGGGALARDASAYLDDWRQPPFTTATVGRGPGATPKTLSRGGQGTADPAIRTAARRIAETNPILALLLVDGRDTVVAEHYGNGATRETLIKGNSMTKGAVSVAVGHALCTNVIRSLDDRAETYSRDLAGTAYGRATIRQLLTMASGGTRAASAGMPVAGMAREMVTAGRRTVRSTIREFGIDHPAPSVPGTFAYKGLDTNALSLVLADATGRRFQDYLSTAVWQRIGAAQDALIQVDRNGDAAANSGLGATAEDWARLAIHVRDATREGSCLGEYLRTATSSQIRNGTETGNLFAAYGFQFWTENRLVRTRSAWFNGFDGQRIGIDLETGRIVVLLSYELGAVREVYELFDRWTKGAR